jgi:hypothetical protein
MTLARSLLACLVLASSGMSLSPAAPPDDPAAVVASA